jgi:hypothetical protein
MYVHFNSFNGIYDASKFPFLKNANNLHDSKNRTTKTKPPITPISNCAVSTSFATATPDADGQSDILRTLTRSSELRVAWENAYKQFYCLTITYYIFMHKIYTWKTNWLTMNSISAFNATSLSPNEFELTRLAEIDPISTDMQLHFNEAPVKYLWKQSTSVSLCRGCPQRRSGPFSRCSILNSATLFHKLKHIMFSRTFKVVIFVHLLCSFNWRFGHSIFSCELFLKLVELWREVSLKLR